MARAQLYRTFLPVFGTGAPDGTTPQRPYFDTSTNPYTPYIYNPGVGWEIYSPPDTPVNADALQGEAVSATPPTGNQILVFNGSEYVPT